MEKKGYMDFHSHVLPAVDDGSENMEMTKSMIAAAYAQGVRILVATPHNYPEGMHPSGNKILEILGEVRKEVGLEYPDLKLICGNEIFYREGVIEELEKGEVLSINQGRYVLIEFHPCDGYKRIYYGLKELVENGYLPVVAHVERVFDLYESPQKIKELIQMGCYMQSNCEAYMGGFFNRRRKTMIQYINEGLIHFLGSDAHNLKDRPPVMEDCINSIRKKTDALRLEQILYSNPQKCLENKFI